jgi:hypothetical protein
MLKSKKEVGKAVAVEMERRGLSFKSRWCLAADYPRDQGCSRDSFRVSLTLMCRSAPRIIDDWGRKRGKIRCSGHPRGLTIRTAQQEDGGNSAQNIGGCGSQSSHDFCIIRKRGAMQMVNFLNWGVTGKHRKSIGYLSLASIVLQSRSRSPTKETERI